MDHGTTRTRELLERGEPLDVSLVELVIAASECSDDGFEISDRVDTLLASGRVQIHPHG